MDRIDGVVGLIFGPMQCTGANTGFVAVAAGGYHSLGLKADGSIGLGGITVDGQRNVPSSQYGLCGDCGRSDYSLGLKADGSIVGWGIIFTANVRCHYPNTGFMAVSAGDQFSVGLKADGSIVAWGRQLL